MVVCDRDNVSLIEFFPDFYWFVERAFKGDHLHTEHAQTHLSTNLVDVKQKTNQVSQKDPN